MIRNLTDLLRELRNGRLCRRGWVEEMLSAIDEAGEEGAKVLPSSSHDDAARAGCAVERKTLDLDGNSVAIGPRGDDVGEPGGRYDDKRFLKTGWSCSAQNGMPFDASLRNGFFSSVGTHENSSAVSSGADSASMVGPPATAVRTEATTLHAADARICGAHELCSGLLPSTSDICFPPRGNSAVTALVAPAA